MVDFMSFRRVIVCHVLLVLPLFSQDRLRGFLAAEVPKQKQWEQQARATADPARVKEYADFLAAEPHAAGSARSQAVAQYIADHLRQWGLDVTIEEFQPLLPYPTVREVELTGPKPYKAKLKEPALPEDPDTNQTGQLPTYNAYAATGDVTAEVVYANYGVPEDYDWLAKHGIDVKGKIVLTRYGKSWRGIKPKVAADHGALACLIYSDPHEDGYAPGDIYPRGPMRPWDGVQRGSVLDMPLYPGDPLTPGWASTPGANRLDKRAATSLMRIPVLPISYADASPVLEQLAGPVVPNSWRGSLPFTYHAGGRSPMVHIRTDYDWTNKTIYDVIATIPGTTAPDEWVMAGNHYDAWVNGADDPVSGAAALLETARALGNLKRQGWNPKRTIKLAFWDGEEFGLMGSTEWVEKHQDELKTKAVAYFNSDSTGRGWLQVSGSHTLEQFITDVAESVQQPDSSQSLSAAHLNHPPVDDDPEAPTPKPAQGKDRAFKLGALGAGSDYVAFLDYVGVASTDENFSGVDKSGIYHSIYDSLYWYNHFSDGTHIYGRALSEFTVTALVRMAGADILPFEFTHLTNTVVGYADEIEHEAETKGQKLKLSELRKQLDVLKASSEKYEHAVHEILEPQTLDNAKVAALNRTLIDTERTLTRPDGLPNRSWYKHQIYAPGFYTGYGVKTLPGIREAVDSKDWNLVIQQEKKVAESLAALAQKVEHAAEQVHSLK
jgi:N-acetylated-alpha-linked acidic dipeptidase